MESLDENLFFRALTTTFKKRYQEIMDNCYHVCIPANGSYDPKQLNDKFVTSHILKPSPLLKSHFLPFNNKQNFHVQIDGKIIKVTKGFGDQNHYMVRILNEEQAYNNANKRYNILMCEKPLISSLNCKLNYESFNFISKDVELVSFEDCERFLCSISRAEVTRLKQEINQLMKTYIILPDYLDDVARKLKKIIDSFITVFMGELSKNVSHRNNRESLSSTVESYSIGLIYDRLIGMIQKKMAKEDEIFVRKVRSMRSRSALKPTDFGAQKAFEKFAIPVEIIRKFGELERKTTPLSKLNCMRQTLDAVNDQLKRTVDEHKSPFDNRTEKIYIMSDDLIAAVICVLEASEPSTFCSTIEFIHTFSWYLPQNSELGYSLVTFEVAKEFIVNYSSPDMNPYEHKANIARCNLARGHPPRVDRFNADFSSLDHEIEKITQIIGNSDSYVNKSDHQQPAQSGSEELGGFLGSLAGNFLTASGQKS